MPVAENLETGLPVDANLIVGIYGNQGHLAQHFHDGIGLAVGVGLDIVANAVHLLLNELLLSSNLHILELDVIKHIQ